MILAIVLICLYCTHCLLTQNMADKTFKKQRHQSKKANITIDTVCNNINLTIQPYKYQGQVRSGYLKVGKGQSAFGFIFFGKRGAKQPELKNIPTIIWLNGGPGSSSQIGNFFELGPFLLKQNQSKISIVQNNFSWTNNYNVLFIDQPIGTGLSYADTELTNPYVKNMGDVALDFYNALKELYQNDNGCFKQMGISYSSKLYIFGQSYAGKYVPAIAAYLLFIGKHNLYGIGIGDGFTSPMSVISQFGGFSYNLGLIDSYERYRIEQHVMASSFFELRRDYEGMFKSFNDVLNKIESYSGGVNLYDFTKYKPYNTGKAWLKDIVDRFLSQDDIKQLFSLNSDLEFGSQGRQVFKNLEMDFMKGYTEKVQFVLKNNISVLVYNGQNDIIVLTPGTMRWVDRLEYSGSQEFRKALFQKWKVNGKTVGSFKRVKNLQFRIVNNAGHLLPMDQPQNALHMVRQFVERTCKSQSIMEQINCR